MNNAQPHTYRENVAIFSNSVAQLRAIYDTACQMVAQGEWVAKQLDSLENEGPSTGTRAATQAVCWQESAKSLPTNSVQARMVWSTAMSTMVALAKTTLGPSHLALGLYIEDYCPQVEPNKESLGAYIERLTDYHARVLPLLQAGATGTATQVS